MQVFAIEASLHQHYKTADPHVGWQAIEANTSKRINHY